MDFELDDDQLELQRVVRDVVERECPPALVRAVLAGGDEADGLWKQYVQLDWPSLTVPAADGGMEATAVELVITLEELGRAADPTPFLATTSQYVPLVREFAAGDRRRELLGAVCAGGTGAAAYAAGEVRARRDGDGWVLDGIARHVVDGDRADELAVVAGSDEGVGIFLVPAGAVDAVRTPTFDGSVHLADVTFAGARVGADRAFRGPGVDRGVERARDEAVAGLAATMVGACQRVLEIVVDHVKQPPAVRRADRLVPGGQAHGRRHVHRRRAGPGAVPLRRADHRRGRPAGGRWPPRWPRRPPATASAWSPGAASSCSAASASPGRTTCSCTCGGPRWASRCSARPPSTGPGRPARCSPPGRRRRRDAAELRRAHRGVPPRVRGVARRERPGRGHGDVGAAPVDRRHPGLGPRLAAQAVRRRLAAAREPARARRPQRHAGRAVRAPGGAGPAPHQPELQPAGPEHHRSVDPGLRHRGAEAPVGGPDPAGRDHRRPRA